jgi:hypothetical protein
MDCISLVHWQSLGNVSQGGANPACRLGVATGLMPVIQTPLALLSSVFWRVPRISDNG